jgi:hypothetical protein
LKCGHVGSGVVAWFRQAETEKVDFSALECASRPGVTTGTEKSRRCGGFGGAPPDCGSGRRVGSMPNSRSVAGAVGLRSLVTA